MGRIIMPGGGEAVDLDVITASAADVKAGKVIVDKDGNPVNGTMAAVAGKTVTPGKVNQTVISTGQWANGNIVVAGDSNLIAANIKKGAKLFGVTGTFEGYVPSDNDLYLRGNNIAGWSANNEETTFGAGAIYYNNFRNGNYIVASKSYNLSSYTKLNVQGRIRLSYLNTTNKLYLNLNAYLNDSEISELKIEAPSNATWESDFANSFNISAVNKSGNLKIETRGIFAAGSSWLQIYRIWLS